MKTRIPSKLEAEYLNGVAQKLGNHTKYSFRNIISNLRKAKLKREGKRIEISSAQRKRIYKRDNYRCVLCGCKHNLCIHHRKEVSKGGTNDDDNLVTLCYPCHAKQHPDISEMILNQWYDILLEEIYRCHIKT